MAKERKLDIEEEHRLPANREEWGISPFGESIWESPFRMIRRFHDEIDRIFSEFGFPTANFPSMPPTPYERMRPITPAVDVWETDQDVKIRADLPGVEPENLEIYTTEDSLTFRAEKKHEEEARERGFYRTERRFGRYERSISLPAAVKPDQAKASFKNGVLEITLPKSEEEKERMKRVPIETEGEQISGKKGGRTRKGK